jgi:lipopolysaccharide transport system permease protein
MVGYLRELIDARELLFSWTLREFRVRYSQSVLGAAWAVLQPLALMAIFTVVFSLFLRVPTQDIPYPIFAYSALLPWTFFVNSLSTAIPSLVMNFNLVSKVYFPREILPLAAIAVGFVDFVIASVIFVAMAVAYQIAIGPAVLWLPLALLVQVILTLALSLWASALNVFYRDIRFVVPLALQLWMYATPVIYPLETVPAWLRPFYLLNPMATLIDTYRRLLFFNQAPDWPHFAAAALLSLAGLALAYGYFKRAERQFADLI